MDVPRSPQLLYQNFIFKNEVVLEVANFCEMLYSWGICIFTAEKITQALSSEKSVRRNCS